ncbi:MAG: hypothetical protein GEU78_07965 [Actinobacteria bacterium]|nr:hypothetical protein [Actinomycetota bacterium]
MDRKTEQRWDEEDAAAMALGLPRVHGWLAPEYYKDDRDTALARSARNDRIKGDASERLGLGRSIGGGSEWMDLPPEVRAAELAYQREIDGRPKVSLKSAPRDGSGQGRFRAAVLERDKQCVATGTPVGTCIFSKGQITSLIQAAHIKPHRLCEEGEYYDPDNGLAMRADVHAAFDAGLFTLNDFGEIISSRWLQDVPLSFRVLVKLTEKQRAYLAGHRRWAFDNWNRWAF